MNAFSLSPPLSLFYINERDPKNPLLFLDSFNLLLSKRQVPFPTPLALPYRNATCVFLY